MTIKYDIKELDLMLSLGVVDLEIKNNYILLEPKTASYFMYMKSKQGV